MRHQTEITISDQLKYSLKDIRISFRENLFTDNSDLIVLGTTEVYLGRDEAIDLIRKLQSAVALVGEDFIVHHDGSLMVDNEEYATVTEFRNITGAE